MKQAHRRQEGAQPAGAVVGAWPLHPRHLPGPRQRLHHLARVAVRRQLVQRSNLDTKPKSVNNKLQMAVVSGVTTWLVLPFVVSPTKGAICTYATSIN